jgi:hypothetical protein
MKNKDIKDTIYKNVYQNSSNGYVLTPSELAFEMVSTLPNSVFQSETTTFLDPICKSGTFLFEIVEKLYSEGHSVSNIQSRIFTVDSNSHSLNVANYYIKKLINKEIGIFKVDYKSDFLERLLNRVVVKATKGKFKTLEDFFDIILLDKKDIYLMTELKNSISEFIEKYEKVSKLESKLFGEVFTPRQLIDEMLDTLPEEVWKDPNRKWLDPAVGIGNFPAAIMDRLMVGLEEAFPNDDNRRKHILEEMLYMCDISTKNLFLLYMLFDKNNEFKLNVYRGSFLEEGFDKHMKDVWGLDGFDVILGNPPYNENGTGTGNSIWHLFVEKTNILSLQYICFIHPSSWRMPLREGDRFYKSSQIIKNNAQYLKILKTEDANSHFGLSIKVDYYLLDKINRSEFCHIDTKEESVNLNIKSLQFIPNYGFDLYDRLTNDDEKCEVVYSYMYDPRNTFVSTEKNEEYKYTLVHSTTKKGNLFRYSSVNDRGHFGISKIIFGESGLNDVIIDMNGDYGMTQGAIGIKVSSVEEANSIKSVLLSEKFNVFLKSVLWSNFRIDWRLFTQLKKDFWKEFQNND